MKKVLSIILLLALSLGVCSCKNNQVTDQGGTQNGAQGGGVATDDGKMIITARIDEIYNAYLNVTATDGVAYRVNLGKATAYTRDGVDIAKEALEVGDRIEITYNGQVTRSLPPQIAALDINIIERAPTAAKQMKSADISSELGDDEFYMIADVIECDERLYVTVTESEYAYGSYVIIVAPETVIEYADGASAAYADISVGASLYIVYSGQVMLSMPPQTVAHKIVIFG